MKLKKRLAVLLTAAMVMGMTIPAGATTLSTNEVPGGGNSTGTGSIEDHLEKEATKIILPTISSDAFNFTVDPERLVQATGGARFTEAGHSIDNTTMDKGVFFLISENEAGNKTYSYQTPQFAFENRSSFAIDLTVQVEAQHNVEDTDLALLSENELTGASEAGVYLGLKVGKDNLDTAEATAVKYDAPAKLNVSVNGVEDNFQVSWNGTGYVYEEKGEVSDWSSGVFQVEGQATKGIDITEDTSAPLINVTWSWSKYGEVNIYESITGGTLTGKNKVLAITDSVATLVFKSEITKIEKNDGTGFEELGSFTNVTKDGKNSSISKTYWEGKSSGFKIRYTTADGTLIVTK